MSIAVSPYQQGSGVGRLLLREFLDEARRRGARCVSLTTDRLGNDKTNWFYVRGGFACAGTFTTAEGRAMNTYRMYL